MLNNYTFTYQRSLFVLNSELPQKPDGEPIENLSKRHKADSKTKSTKAAKAGDEVQPSHLWQPLELWETRYIIGRNSIVTHQIQWAPQRRCSQWRCPSHRRCNRSRPENHQRSIFVVNESNLGKGIYELPLPHVVREVPPHRP